jgi:hypothetical protein
MGFTPSHYSCAPLVVPALAFTLPIYPVIGKRAG